MSEFGKVVYIFKTFSLAEKCEVQFLKLNDISRQNIKRFDIQPFKRGVTVRGGGVLDMASEVISELFIFSRSAILLGIVTSFFHLRTQGKNRI